MNYYGIQFLQNKLTLKRNRVLTRYAFYEMKNAAYDFGISTPPELKYWNSVVGWCAKGVDSLADRLNFHEFQNDVFGLNEIYDMNNRDVLFDSAVLGALISSCDFVYVSEDETGFPRLQVIDGGNATGIINPINEMLDEGYAVLERDEFGNPKMEAYFTYEYTAYYENGQLVDSRVNKAPYPCLVPVIFKPDSVRPFGHSRISRACMSAVGSALRTIKRSEISAEFYSFPQKWATGLDPNAEQMDKWMAAMSAMIKFAAEVGLTLDDLGFPSENPSSYEAIKAAHENLRLTAKKAQRNFNVGLLNAGYLAACIRDNMKYQRSQLTYTKPVWAPVFPADVSMIGAIGDAVGKINTVYPEYFTEDKLFELTGI